MSDPLPAATLPPSSTPVGEVRYPLDQLLREVEYERQNSALGRELVDQAEIKSMLERGRLTAKSPAG